MRSPFHTLAHRIITAWLAHRDARQRQQRHARLCRLIPDYQAASEALERDRKRHKQTRADIARMRAALHEELRREVSHG